MDYKKRLEGVYTDNSFAFFHDGPIVRGSTQVHSFRIPNDITNIREVFVTYNQRETVYTSEVIDNKVTLSEVDTFKFKANEETTVQLKIATETEYIVSPIFYIEVEKGLDELQKTYDDDFYAIDITVNKQSIRALSYLPEAINGTYLKCKFTFDNTWNDKQKIVYFKDEFNHLIKTSLSYNWCLIPTIILSNPGIINIGVYSDASRSTIWSNDINVAAGLLFLPDIDSGATECESPQPATATRAGLAKLYDTLDYNIDGAVTQRCVTANFEHEKEKRTEAINNLNEKLDKNVQEIHDQINNVNTDLLEKLSNEATLRQEADNHLESLLNEEINRATNRENEIETQLTTGLNEEIRRAKEAEETISNNLVIESNRAIEAERALTDNLNVEITRAEEAEQLLTTNLNTEISRAKEAEKLLTDNLNAEVQRSTIKDNELTTGLNSEIERATQAESDLSSKLDTEKAERISSDDALSSRISTEIIDRKNADDVLDKKVKAEETRALSAEDVLDEKIDTEISRATIAESDLNQNLTTEISRAKQSEKTLETNLNAETQRATTKENELETNLNTEIQRAETKENEIAANLEKETSSRISEDNALSSRIDSEASSREDNDNLLNEKIESEITRAKGAENKISSDLASEISRAEGIETTLGNTLTNEVNRAKEAESTLSGKIDDEISRAKAKENELNAKIEKNIETTNLEYNIYEGEDLTIKYADEIANYSDEWAWIKARIKAVNFKGLRIHDYIPVKCSNNKVLRMEIAGIDTYYRNGSPEVGHHIDFISKECWDVTVQYNKVNINNGTADQVVPFMASNLKKFLMSEAGPVPNSTTDMSVTTEVDYTNDGIWHFLPDKLKNVIVEKNFFKVNRYTEGSIRTTDNTDWGWFNLSKLWLPTEKEVYGSSVYEGNAGSYGIFGRQYPCFIGHSRFKGIVGDINARCLWWLLSPCSGNSSHFCYVTSNGCAIYTSASNTYVRVPVCFRIA